MSKTGQIQRQKSKLVVALASSLGREEWRMTANDTELPFLLELIVVVSQLCAYTKIIKLYTYRRVNST